MPPDDLFLLGLIAVSVLFIAIAAVRSRRQQSAIAASDTTKSSA
jgi:hypothetical protein